MVQRLIAIEYDTNLSIDMKIYVLDIRFLLQEVLMLSNSLRLLSEDHIRLPHVIDHDFRAIT